MMTDSIAGGRMFSPLGAAVLTQEQRKSNKALENKLIEAIVQDPEIQHPTNLSVFIRQENGKTYAHLIGKVAEQAEKERVEEITDKNTPIETVVVNEVVLD